MSVVTVSFRRYTDTAGLEAWKEKVEKARARLAKRKTNNVGARDSAFLRYCRERTKLTEVNPAALSGRQGADYKRSLVDEWLMLKTEDRRKFVKRAAAACPEPVTSRFRPDSNFGAVTEAVEDMINGYLGDQANVDKESFKVSLLQISHMCTIAQSTNRSRFFLGNGLSEDSARHGRPWRARGGAGGPVGGRAVDADDAQHLPLRRQRRDERHTRYSQTQRNTHGKFKRHYH